MGKNTLIRWAHHTFNIVWGCTKISPGCKNCYAAKWAKRCGVSWGRRAKRRVFTSKYWRKPIAWNAEAERAGQRRRVFCSSMADVFEDHPTVAAERAKLWALIEATPWLDWLLVTKRPENIDAMMPAHWRGKWPRNVWLGFTGEDQKRFDERWEIVEWLGRMNSIAVLFCSMEPMLELIDIEHALYEGGGDDEPEGRTLDWLIIGGESGGGARPFDLNWIGFVLHQLDGLITPVFVKQVGSNAWLLGRRFETKHPKGEEPSEWPCQYRRQEFPKP